MRELLFLAHRIPYPPDKGDKIRAWNIFRYLARTHRMHLGCFIDDPADRQHLAMLAAPVRTSSAFRSTAHPASRDAAADAPRPAACRSAISRTGGCSAGWTPSWPTARSTASTCSPPPWRAMSCTPTAVRRILDMVDVDSEKWTAYAETARFPARSIWAREGRTLLAFERLRPRASITACSSPSTSGSASCHWRRRPSQRTSWVSNGVDLDHFSPAHSFAPPFAARARNSCSPAAWTTGRTSTRCSGSRARCCRRCASACPRALLDRRRRADQRVRALAELPGVQVTGRVPDTRPYLAAADVVVAPLRIARGIQNKLLEAMAMARPVVATPEAFEGVRAEPGRDILLASGVGETVQRIADVLDGRHATMGAAARRAVEASHQWSVTLRPLDRLFGVTQPEQARADLPA